VTKLRTLGGTKLILRNIINSDENRCHILRLNALNSISAGAPPQTPLGELTGFQGVLLLREGKGKGEGGERKGSGKVIMAFGGMGASGILFSKRNLYQKKNRARKHKYSDKILECVDNIGMNQCEYYHVVLLQRCPAIHVWY